MVREISAGGVVVRQREGTWWMAAIEPAGEPTTEPAKKDKDGEPDSAAKTLKRKKSVLALPKGLVDPGEKPLATALREVHEETGVVAEEIAKLADIKYVYTRSWGDRQRVFKIVSFYLMRYVSGRIDQITPEMRVEVARARWIPLEDGAKLLAYKGEKQMAKRAHQYVLEHPEL